MMTKVRMKESGSLNPTESQASMKDDCMLAILARGSAVAIVERYASEVRDREGLIEAIARLALIGLEGHVQLWEQSQEVSK